MLYPLGPPGAEYQRSSQVTRVHLVETGVQLCFDVLWLPQKRNLRFPVLTNTRSGFYLAEVLLREQVTAVKVLFPHEVLLARNQGVSQDVLFVAFAYRAFGAKETPASCCPVVTDASLSEVKSQTAELLLKSSTVAVMHAVFSSVE